MKTKKETNVKKNELSFIEKTTAFFDRHEKKLIYLIMAISLLMSILLFDVKVSLSGDDCDYIVAANAFWKNFTYPGHHGPLYPIVLSLFVGVFGIKLVLLKSLSTLFMVSSLWLFYKSFQRLVPTIILLPALFLVSINPYVFFFASYTYSEPLYLFMQALFFYFFSMYFWRDDTTAPTSPTSPCPLQRGNWGKYVVIALVIIGLGLTRTIGFCTIGIVILYFMMVRRWKDLIYTVSIFALLFGLIYVLKPVIWPDSASVQSFETLLAKNTYNPEQGAEDLSGLMTRVIGNSHVYLSSWLYKYLGFRSSTDMPLEDRPFLTLLTYFLFVVCLFALFRQNKFLLFAGVYAGILLFTNFILLHTVWVQDRFIMVYYPYIILFLFGGLFYLFKMKRFKKMVLIYPLILASVLVGTSIHAKKRVGRHIPVLQQNLLGNDLYGLTPDWENFIKMCRWVNVNCDKDAVVVSRKPTISFVYTGRTFFGIYSVPYVTISEIVESSLKDQNDYLFLVIEKATNHHLLNGIMPYLQYIFVSPTDGSFKINDKTIQAAIVYKIDKARFSHEVIDFLIENEFNYTLDHHSFFNQYVEDKRVNYQIINPDILYENIISSNIKYLILPKIRLYTYVNSGLFINTIHQYLTFIQFKYANQFLLIHTIGKDETCELIEFIGQ